MSDVLLAMHHKLSGISTYGLMAEGFYLRSCRGVWFNLAFTTVVHNFSQSLGFSLTGQFVCSLDLPNMSLRKALG